MKTGNISVINIFKTILCVIFFALQLLVFLLVLWDDMIDYWDYGFWVTHVISLGFVFSVVMRRTRSSSKLSWIIFILTLPICGCICYLLWGRMSLPRKMRIGIARHNALTEENLKQDPKIFEDLTDITAKSQAALLLGTSGYPVYKNTRSVYFNSGEEMFDSILLELSRAKRFIFIEFFIMKRGRMLEEIMSILEEKAANGLEVRIIYDYMGSAGRLPAGFKKRCEQNGIYVGAFNPPGLSLYKYVNFRDHRKIIVIDGNTAFTGGINISDEYINDINPFGHWKDGGVLLRGDAVWSFTVMFLTMWDMIMVTESDIPQYHPTLTYVEEPGYVLPFSDGPHNRYNPAESVFIKMIMTARRYVFIQTPYLIIDSDMMSAIALAVRSGVDVRIITPHIPDKRFVFAETRSFYEELISYGASIYEYTPGFVHAKTVCVDDKTCFIGTVNFDYRSLLWNFECGVWIFDKTTALSLREDFLYAQEESQRVNAGRRGPIGRLWSAFLRILAPLV